MTKRFFIIPGFTHKPTDKCYRWLSAFLKKQGFAVQLVIPKDAPHEIDYPTYVEAIKKALT